MRAIRERLLYPDIMQLDDPEPLPIVDMKHSYLPLLPHLDLSRSFSEIINPGPAAMDLSAADVGGIMTKWDYVRTPHVISRLSKVMT